MAAGHPEGVSDSVAGLVTDITENRHVSIIPNYPSWRNRPGTAQAVGDWHYWVEMGYEF